jgi:2-dehydropantoate 2-reductase
MYKWYISGVGSISCLISANLTQHNIPNQQIIRESSKLNAHQLIKDSEVIQLPKPIYLSSIHSIDNLIIATKAYDVLSFFQQTKSLLSPSANVILCHNGMGTIEQLELLLEPTQSLYFVTTNNGVFKSGNQAHFVGEGPSYWSEASIPTDRSHGTVSNEFWSSLFDNCSHQKDLTPVLWKKLIINCAINPLTAIHQVKNGELAGAMYQSVVKEVIDECLEVCKRLNIVLDENLHQVVKNVINNTKDNYSSMHQDTRNNKTTEIDYITGYLIQQAKKVGLDVPTNQKLYKQVLSLSAC